MAPRVTVIIPAHNAARFLEQCLDSLERQTFQDWEVIVVDDASTDGTAALAARFARVLSAPRNLGAGAARNRGAREARGEILAFTDADVVLPPDWLEKIARGMESPACFFVGGGYSGTVGSSFLERFALLELFWRRRNLTGIVNTLVSNNFACRRQEFFAVGGFLEKHPFTVEDLVLSFVASRKYPIHWDRDNGVRHHFRDTLGGYLRQQYRYARDTVWAFRTYPGMFLVTTHQGRTLYLEVLLTAMVPVALAWNPWLSLLPAGVWISLNAPLLWHLRKEGLPLLRALATMVIRDLAILAGLVSGVVRCAKEAFP